MNTLLYLVHQFAIAVTYFFNRGRNGAKEQDMTGNELGLDLGLVINVGRRLVKDGIHRVVNGL